jgi:hypothetical protein
MNKTRLTTLIAGCSVIACAGLAVQTPPKTSSKLTSGANNAFFEAKIRPILTTECLPCHSRKAGAVQGRLSMDTRIEMLTGASKGPLVVPGKPKDSLLMHVVRHLHPSIKMPPGKKLTDAQLQTLDVWITNGAIDPRGAQQVVVRPETKDQKEWAYRKPIAPSVPSETNGGWASLPIDHFVAVAQKRHGLQPATPANGKVLLRRIAMDITGILPTAAELDEFPDKPTQADVRKAIDTYLESQEYGRRWGRHWLDVARYAESSGKDANVAYPEAWRYRDYVIDSFNANKPYNTFIREQIAGDLLPTNTKALAATCTIATGYLAIGAKSHTERNTRQFRLDVADEQIDAIGQGILGLTVACARCHDHKTDPISQRAYYQLAGIFLSTETHTASAPTNQQRQGSDGIALPTDASVYRPSGLTPFEQRLLTNQLSTLVQQRDELIQAQRRNRTAGNGGLVALQSRIGVLEHQLSRYDASGRVKPLAMGASEKVILEDSPIYTRGERTQPGEVVPRGIPAFLGLSTETSVPRTVSGRLQIADWLVSNDNPLTARVFVNRIWHYLFGRGLVATCDNFGVTGMRPDHPELLDYLAIRFMENGWDIKSLIRDIMLTKTYQMDSIPNGKATLSDPENIQLSHQRVRRMDAESIRDNILAVSGDLDLRVPDGSPMVKVDGQFARRPAFDPQTMTMPYRSVYLPIVRDTLPDALAVFDMAEPTLVIGVREETTVPSQALFLLNSPFVIDAAIKASGRIPVASRTQDERIESVFRMILGRMPSASEVIASKAFLDDFVPESQANSGVYSRVARNAERARWTVFCQSLMATVEFRTIR